MGAFIGFIISVGFGIACAGIAEGRGRSSVGWFFLGFFFSWMALVALAILPDETKVKARERNLREENRRLRERVAKDRMVADDRHRGLAARLDVHDRALGVDTSDRVEIEGAAEPPPLPAATLQREDLLRAVWYFVDDAESCGPIPFADLRRMWRENEISTDTLVWRTGMDDWSSVRRVDGLEAALRG
mgnify:CR=1 FL=1